ncbi:unnamed protein product [Chrysoparadoxa australica]
MATTGTITWDAEVVLAHYLDTTFKTMSGVSVLELGAGTGLAGLAASHLGATVTLTDQPGVQLQSLQANAAANAPVMAAATVDTKDQDQGQDQCQKDVGACTSGGNREGEMAVRELTWSTDTTGMEERLGQHDILLGTLIQPATLLPHLTRQSVLRMN